MEHHSSYVPRCKVTASRVVVRGDKVGDRQLSTPGPLMFRLCDILPWLTTSTVYVPGPMVTAAKLIEYSHSVTVSVVPPGTAEPGPAGVPVGAPWPPPQPANSSAAAAAAAASTTVTLGR